MTTTRSKSNGLANKEKPNQLLFVYPHKQDDSNECVISFTQYDLDQLKAPKFLNDTIITFFMQYNLDQVELDLRDRIYVFNSFFFAKIKAIRAKQKDQEITYKCASKWLGGAKLFDKDFLVMPVFDRDHWLIVIICYPVRRPSLNPKSIPDNELYEPAVFVLNSWYGYAPSVKRALNQFLRYQWHVEKGDLRNFRIHDAKPTGIRLIFPSVPQQRNNYNCGVYMLNYFHCFLKDPRGSYIRMFRKRDMNDWFKQNGIDISCQRRKMTDIIRNQISLYKNLTQGSQEDRSVQDNQTRPSPNEETDQDSVIVIH